MMAHGIELKGEQTSSTDFLNTGLAIVVIIIEAFITHHTKSILVAIYRNYANLEIHKTSPLYIDVYLNEISYNLFVEHMWSI